MKPIKKEIKQFEQNSLVFPSFLNQGEISGHFYSTRFKDTEFYYQCISNTQNLFSEIVSSNKTYKISHDKRGYQDTLFASFNQNPPEISKASHRGEKYILHAQMYRIVSAQN